MGNMHPIHIMSFNIRFDTESDEPFGWSQRRYHVSTLIRFHSPDIVMLQEVLPNQMEDLRRAFPKYEWIYRPRAAGDEACPVGFKLERLTCVDSGTYWLSETPDQESVGWDADLPRTATWAKLDLLGTERRLFAVSVHLDHRGAEARVQSSRLLAELTVSRARDEGLPVVIGGDFNSTEDSPVFEPLRSAGMQDARSCSRTTPLGPLETCPGGGFTVTTAVGARIDYIFVSPNLNVPRFATFTDHLHGIHPSDHFPIWCEVEL